MKVRKSDIANFNPPFDVQVAQHAQAMQDWRAHMKRVEEDRSNPDLPAIERHSPYSRPTADPLVDKSVDENDQPAYEIEDDSENVLAIAKRHLLAEITRLEVEAIGRIFPLAKRRHWDLQESDIKAEDAERRMDLIEQQGKPGLLQRLVGADGCSFDIEAAVAEQRPAEDTKHLQEQAERRRKVAWIERRAAQAHADIEDLTADTIDGWKMPDFSTI